MNKQLASLLFYNETLYVNPVVEKPEVLVKFTTDKHVLVLSKPLTDGEATFLNKILNAVKLSLDAVELVDKSIELPDLVALDSVKYVVSFGELITKNTISANKYKPVLLDGKTFIFSDMVSDVAKNDKQEKVGLWNALKETFLQ
jgi:hypothetical protein